MEKTSRAIEDYLEALLMLQEKGKPLEVSEVANLLGVSKPASTKMMDELKALSYIEKEKYGSITLTEEGLKIAKATLHRHEVLKKMLLLLGVSETNAETDCCHIEHVISEETFKAIEAYVIKKNTDK
jgi:Mn-dependent DtxR family transcriptional regulator